MLEGTISCGGRPTGFTDARTRRATGARLEPRRSDLLARLSAMSLAGVGRRLQVDRDAEEAATAVARAWLDLADKGRLTMSWAAAAPALRRAVDEEEWRRALHAVRTPLGPCRSRTLRRRTTLEAPPGVPRGQYTVILFESAFEKCPRVTETVTTCLGDDGRCRVAAYFVG